MFICIKLRFRYIINLVVIRGLWLVWGLVINVDRIMRIWVILVIDWFLIGEIRGLLLRKFVFVGMFGVGNNLLL